MLCTRQTDTPSTDTVFYDLPGRLPINDSQPESLTYFASEVFDGKSVTKIWARPESSDRVKLTAERRDFTTGTYRWRVYLPPMGAGDQTSVGAYDEHELDFECGYGKEAVRKAHDAGSNELLCHMTSQDQRDKYTVVPLEHSSWYTFELQLAEQDGNYFAKWYINGQHQESIQLTYDRTYN